jgi:hypothetical protein
MRSGDFVATKGGHRWVIAFVLTMRAVEGIIDGRHVLLIRPVANEFFDDLLFTLLPEQEAALGWEPGPEFKKGQTFLVQGEHQVVHSADQLGVFFKQRDGSFGSCWRWQLALIATHDRHLNFEEEDGMLALPEQV